MWHSTEKLDHPSSHGDGKAGIQGMTVEKGWILMPRKRESSPFIPLPGRGEGVLKPLKPRD
jgi:hypothetical protein